MGDTKSTANLEFTGSFPRKSDSIAVPNPKDIVTKALPNIPTPLTEMQATLMDLQLSQWNNRSISDPAQAYSMPAFMLMQAVDNMAEVKKLAVKEKDEEEAEARERKKNLILMIVGVALMFVPVIGEEAASLMGLATMARTLAVANEAANAAYAVYETVDDPSSAVSNIVGMLFGLGSIPKATRDGAGLRSIAKARAAMKDSEVSSFGDIYTNNDNTLQAILKICGK